MEKFIKKISIAIILMLAQLSAAYAQPNVDNLLPRLGENNEQYGGNVPAKTTGTYPETGAVANLPEISINEAVTTVIKTILGWAMIFTIIAIVFAGIYYLISRGKEEDIGKGKNIILYLIIGLAIMAGAYGIVSGVAQFDYFS